MLSRTPLWTLDELCARVALALAVDYSGQASGRVRDVPDRRTIRYYTTLGILDRPAGWRGRTALYGLRHLLQLVAIKRLQTHGLSLAEIQGRLLGLSDPALQELAPLPADFDQEVPTLAAGPAEEPDPAREQAFWTAPPAPVEQDRAADNGREVRLPLAPGVDLVLEALREPDDYDVSALAAAAAPLLKLLRARRLLGPDGGKASTQGEAS
jgi:DNA-binding transcriptional MerR regulator